MRSIKLFSAALAVSGLATGLLITPAQAATGYDRCPANHMCLFSGLDGTGTIAAYAWGSPNTSQQGITKAPSGWNRTGSQFCAYEATDYRGMATQIHPAGRKGNDPSWNIHPVYSIKKKAGNCIPS